MKFEFEFKCKPQLTVSGCFRDSDNQEIMNFIKNEPSRVRYFIPDNLVYNWLIEIISNATGVDEWRLDVNSYDFDLSTSADFIHFWGGIDFDVDGDDLPAKIDVSKMFESKVMREFFKDYQLVTWLDDREIDAMFYVDDYYDGGWYDVTIDESSIDSKAIVVK